MTDHPIARLGDTSSHGGTITTAASNTECEGKRIARVGDILNCPFHGPRQITTGSPDYYVEGKQVARTTSLTACGASIIGGAQKTTCP